MQVYLTLEPKLVHQRVELMDPLQTLEQNMTKIGIWILYYKISFRTVGNSYVTLKRLRSEHSGYSHFLRGKDKMNCFYICIMCTKQLNSPVVM